MTPHERILDSLKHLANMGIPEARSASIAIRAGAPLDETIADCIEALPAIITEREWRPHGALTPPGEWW